MIIKKKKAFTLVEVLAVIVIIGILSTVGIVTVVNIRKNQEKKFNQTQYELFRETAKTYFSDHKSELPIIAGQTTEVYLNDLIEENYLDSLLDYNKNSYKLNSYVEILKLGDNKYFYSVKLYKKGSKEEIQGDTENDTASKIMFSKYYKKSNKELMFNSNDDKQPKIWYTNETLKIDLDITDSEGILAFYYIIYKNNVQIYSSKYVTFDNTNDTKDTLVLDTNSHGDGTYQLEVVVYDRKDHIKHNKSDKIMIDRVAPICETEKPKTVEWTNQNTTIKGKCSDKNGKNQGNSGCITTTVERTITTQTNTVLNRNESPGSVSDKAGNVTQCPADRTVKIDKIAPKCENSGGNSNWTNSDVTITGKCSDEGGSGCKGNATKIYNKNTNSTKESPGTVYDNAGNSTVCKDDRTVKIDKTAPTCKNSGGNANWTNSNVTIKGTCSDTGGSGCKEETVQKTYTVNTNSNSKTPGTVYDNAGNSKNCPSDRKVHIDKTAPTCKNSGGSSNWTNSNVTIKGTCSDTGGSGCKEETVQKTYTVNTNSNSKTPGIVYDNAGNSKNCPSDREVHIDKTPPVFVSCTRKIGLKEVGCTPNSYWGCVYSDNNPYITIKSVTWDNGSVNESRTLDKDAFMGGNSVEDTLCTQLTSGGYVKGEICDIANNCIKFSFTP